MQAVEGLERMLRNALALQGYIQAGVEVLVTKEDRCAQENSQEDLTCTNCEDRYLTDTLRRAAMRLAYLP